MASWKEGDVLAVIHEAMVDDRVQRSMAVAMRDVWMRKRFATLRAAPLSMTVMGACTELGVEFHLGPERVKQIVYAPNSAR